MLVAKLGLDGHELGAISIARGLRNAGMEVIYTGLHQTPEQVTATAIQEDVDVIGVSFYSGSHLGLMQKLMKELQRRGAADQFVLLAGGAIPLEDEPDLKAVGVRGVFSSRSPLDAIAKFIRESVSLN